MESTGTVSRRIIEIYNEHYSVRGPRRVENLFKIYTFMAKARVSAGDDAKLLIDMERIAELVRSYFLDVVRYKEYHFSAKNGADPFSREWAADVHGQRINDSKVATLTAKWILSYKPISYTRPTNAQYRADASLIAVNEHFAMHCACYALGLHIEDIDPIRYDELIYNLRFRRFDEGAYFMVFSKQNLSS